MNEFVGYFLCFFSEMSFKCWMCGGKILIHPCSHVAHVFRKETPYKFLESENIFVTIFKNYKRVALVWLDEYKQLIYAVNPDIKRLNGGDVSDRIALRQNLKCGTFKDYLQMFQLKNFPFNHRFIGTVIRRVLFLRVKNNIDLFRFPLKISVV